MNAAASQLERFYAVEPPATVAWRLPNMGRRQFANDLIILAIELGMQPHASSTLYELAKAVALQCFIFETQDHILPALRTYLEAEGHIAFRGEPDE